MSEHRFELATDGPTRILLGVDGSETSMRASAYALGLARRQGSVLVALYVRAMTFSTSVAVSAGLPLETSAPRGDELRENLQSAAAELRVTMTFLTAHGNPYFELIRVAEQMHVDAIVVGASCKAGHRIVGSLAGHLVKDAKWPVTVVP